MAAVTPGTTSTRCPAAATAAITAEPGSETVGIPASLTRPTRSPGRHPVDDLGDPGDLGVLVCHEQGRRNDPHPTKEPPGPSGVLAGDGTASAERLGGPRTEVGDVADRGADHDQSPG